MTVYLLGLVGIGARTGLLAVGRADAVDSVAEGVRGVRVEVLHVELELVLK